MKEARKYCDFAFLRSKTAPPVKRSVSSVGMDFLRTYKKIRKFIKEKKNKDLTTKNKNKKLLCVKNLINHYPLTWLLFIYLFIYLVVQGI
jgi:hypothetical protein